MDRVEAKWLLLRKLADYRQQYPYDELRNLIGGTQCVEIAGRSGTEYQIEFCPIWDDQPDGDIRVLASVDDAGWRVFCPLSCDFLASPPNNSSGSELGSARSTIGHD